MTVPGIGPRIATAIATLAPPPETFRKARDSAAWLGLVARQYSTGGKQRLEATTTMGERSLRPLLIIGANSVIIKRHVHSSAQPGTWLAGMLSRKPPMLVRVALANIPLAHASMCCRAVNGAYLLGPDGPRWRFPVSSHGGISKL
jgi:transposase